MFQIIPVVGPEEFFFLFIRTPVGYLLYVNKLYLEELGPRG